MFVMAMAIAMDGGGGRKKIEAAEKMKLDLVAVTSPSRRSGVGRGAPGAWGPGAELREH
jgi:hypothetical protein